MAAAPTLVSAGDSEHCVLCSSKYNRTRPSFCQCKHCSIPLCLDCMKEHHDEFLQDVAQISHQYNELQQLLQMKQTMIVDEIAKSIEDVHQYFDKYIHELRDTQQKIIVNMEQEKQNAQDQVQKIDVDLRSLGGELQGLTKESIVQMTKMKYISTELQKIEQQLSTYQATRTENLINTRPDFSIKFDCQPAEVKILHSTDTESDKTRQTDPQVPSSKSSKSNMLHQPIVVQDDPLNQPEENDHSQNEDNNSRFYDNDDTATQYGHMATSYDIDRMASDGQNILYTSYYDEEPDLIAYYRIDGNNNRGDEFRDWKQSRIQDMIWWGDIGKFVCATNDGIYTVDYVDGRFKIASVTRGKWSYIRVAAISHQLFVWVKCLENGFHGIGIYPTNFQYIKTINFDTHLVGSCIGSSSSFCVTNNLIASICVRKQNNRQVFQVIFCDLNMNKLNSVPLGECHDDIEIRTDGKDRFFITTGRRRFYIVSSNGEKQTINLQNDGDCIAVLNHQRVAVSNQRASIEIITY